MFRLAVAAALLAFASTALPQGDYPNRTVRIIVPFTPGSVTDIMARTVSERLGTRLGQPVVVENRPGAGGTIGTGAVAKSPPDGYTLAVVAAGHVVTPAIYENLAYDPAKDFAGIAPIANLPSVLFVSSALGVKSAQELIALAKAKPGALNYPSAGVGSASHVSAEKFRMATGITAVHVPLKGAPEVVTEVIAGRAHYGLMGVSALVAHVREGRVVPLAVTSEKRLPMFPDVPTVAEIGLPQAQFDFWIGMLAPAQTPRPIVNRLNGELAALIQTSEMHDRLASLGAEPMPMKPEQFDAYMRQQLANLVPLMRAAGVKAN
jgi:tripartite-type tricarboxylate transporter receptor subunit TctC